MTLSLGIDTGGTYTDAVLLRDETTIVASAKSLTTRHDLAVGIGNAVRSVLDQASADPAEISLASLSTTLATNALIEGQGERVGLIIVGFDEDDLMRHGLLDALNGDPVLQIAGGHDHAGNEVCPLNESALRLWLETHQHQVAAFAVAARFATRNTAHERQIASLLRGKPVSCSHQLSSKLNGPKRALTAVLNARLIGMIDRLIARTRVQLDELRITCPLMVVRGDGALISAEIALQRPIETILSGPAASIVGAKWLTGASDALVSDIGGTTTDIAVLHDGRPALDPDGARVGPHRTMVEAVKMRTTGLGGDSEVHFIAEGLAGGISLGPQRVLPIALLGQEAPDIVADTLDRQLRSETRSEQFGRFIRAIKGANTAGISEKEQALLDKIGDAIWPLQGLFKSRMEHALVRKLRNRGLVQIASVTPSDASHALGHSDVWNADAANSALALFARQRTGSGKLLAQSADEMAQMIVDQLTKQTSLALLETCFEEDGMRADLAHHALTHLGLRHHRGLIKVDLAVNMPVVGLGASAPTYYPAVGKVLGCTMELPEHADVANAIGAIVGRVRIRKSSTITAPSDGLFRAHLGSETKDFATSDEALAYTSARLTADATNEAKASGAIDIEANTTYDIKNATIEGAETFVEATLVVEASGRPGVAATTNAT